MQCMYMRPDSFDPVAPHRWDTSHRDVAHFHPAGRSLGFQRLQVVQTGSVESNDDIPRGAHRADTSAQCLKALRP